MGFGSYDETDQREPEIVTEEDGEADNADLHKHDHEGVASFEAGASTDDLIDRLAGIMKDVDDE